MAPIFPLYEPPGQVPSNATEFIIIRHGETTWNTESRIQGQMEPDLSSMGKNQAEAVARRLASGDLPFSAVYSSDLRRAYDTAKEIARITGHEVIRHRGLRERHAGFLQGLTTVEAKEKQPHAYEAFISKQTNVPIPGGGESIDDLYERATLTLESIAAKHQGERVVVMCHGGVLNAFHHHATGQSPSKRSVNTSLNVLQIKNGEDWRVSTWDDITHLNSVGFHAQAFGSGCDSA